MKINHVVFDRDTFGITCKSLKMLRDAISQGYTQRVAVVEVQTNAICCGFVVINRDMESATWTGDGFRTDGGGEGGAGYRSAKALFNLFRIYLIHWDEMVNVDELYKLSTTDAVVAERLRHLAEEIVDTLEDGDYRKLVENEPAYIS